MIVVFDIRVGISEGMLTALIVSSLSVGRNLNALAKTFVTSHIKALELRFITASLT